MDTTPTRRELLQSLGVAVTATAVGGHATGQPVDQTTWPTLGADNQNTGFSPDAPGPETAPNPLWTVETREPIEGSAAVSDGMVFVGGTNNTFYGFDVESGDESDEGWELETGGEIHSTPAVSDIDGDERVYVGSDDGVVYAFDRATGTELDSWSFSVDGQIRSSPTVVEELADVDPLVFIGAGGAESGLYALDADTGEIEWEQGTDADVVGAPAVSVSGEETIVYCCTEDGRLLALDATDGTSRWPPFEDDDEGGGFSSSPVVSDDYVYAASRDSTLYAIDPETGESDWEFETGGVIVATPALGEEYLYLGSRDGSVYAISPATGAEEWEFETDQLIVAPPAIGGDTVFVCTSPGGDLLALDAATGEEQWAVAVRGDIRAQPVVADNRIYLGDGSGQFYALDPDADEEGGVNGESDDADDGVSIDQFSFLAWPASILAMLGIGGGIVYAASRAGLFSRIEEAADSVGPDREEILAAENEANAADNNSESTASQSTPSAVWELVLDDVISRSEATDSTAADDLLVTKYVDRETLESPVVAYEIESFRDEPATVRLSEPFVTEPADAESTPLGDNWAVTDELTFEQQIGPGETVRTIVGRRDCPTERAEELLERPTIEVSEE